MLLTGAIALVAVLAGLFATLVAALTGVAIMLARQLLRRPRTAANPQASRTRRARRAPADAIDVVATEVPTQPRSLP